MAKIKGIGRAEANLNEILENLQNAIFARLNCHNIGRILEFDKKTQTATIEPMQIKQFGDIFIEPVPITDVPLIIYGAGGGHITLPNPTGAICLLFFNDRNMDAFLETGEKYTPESARMHNMTDCIALTTFKTLANPLAEYDERAISIMNEEIIEGIKNKSFIKVYPEKILMQSSKGGQISVNEKINIQSGTQNLAELMQTFLTACENIITVDGGALTPSSKQMFTDLKTKFEELLQ